jgi:septal ring factor EnvC (AmiA/AmiB activator)
MQPRRILTYALALGLLFTARIVAGPNQDEIQKRQGELQAIRNQIKEFEEKIKTQQQHEKATLELLDMYDRKATLLRRLITKLRAEEKRLQDRIDTTRATVADLESQLSFLKKHYAHYVSSVYKSGRIYDIELLLSSNSINQFYIRTEYLKRFTDQRQKDAQRIGTKRSEIEEIQARLQQELTEERRLIAEKGAEEDRLASLVVERKEILHQIRKDKKSVQREIERKLKAAKDLEGIIANLIEMERLRKEREAAEIQRGKLPQPLPIAGTFESRKGKLRWPVNEGSIVARFGNQTHPTLKTITQNTGIDIAVKAGSPVSAVAEGQVSKITWLPSYGNLIIIDHYGGYYTVYTHLAELRVSEQQKVKEGDVIGASGEALDGPRLHFEIYKGREKQNPEVWLMRQ